MASVLNEAEQQLIHKMKEDSFPFWASTEPSKNLYENGLLFESMYDGIYMHLDLTSIVRMIDIDAIIDVHIKAGRLKTE
ncbi:hypothetical protein [Salinicoccus bachuensis]|uniref:Uncharacterized protein n=1 Tax=Salinicoccus bachuensis TaxID=3136731 RepID=A0ABZ3CJU1_9STAP